MSTASLKTLFRALIGPVYLPAVLTGGSQAACAVLLPLYVLHLGYSPSVAALVLAMSGIGQLLADIPAGMVASRYGDKVGLLLGALCNALSYALIAVLPAPLWFGVGAMIGGAAVSFSIIARQSYLSVLAPPLYRGRAISLLGGCMRGGSFIGPVTVGVIAAAAGYQWTFWFLVVIGVLAFALISFTARNPQGKRDSTPHDLKGIISVLKEYRSQFSTAGLAMVALQVMRAGRIVLLPLVGHQLGLSVAQIGFIVSMGAVLDALLFIPTGVLMDKYGRKYAAVPSLTFFSLGLLALGWAEGYLSLLVISVLLGLGNGLSSGLVLVLGADYAPEQGRGRFLGVWKLIADTGQASSPMAISALLTMTSLAVCSNLLAVVGFAGLYIFAARVQETLVRADVHNEQ